MVIESRSQPNLTPPLSEDIELKPLRPDAHTSAATLQPSGEEGTAAAAATTTTTTISRDQDASSTPLQGLYSGGAEATAGSEGGKRSRQLSAHDGVFANMSAMPEVMVLPKMGNESDQPPAYTATTDYEARFGLSPNESPQYDEIVLDDLEVGGYPVFLLYMVVSIFFEWIGFLIALTLSQSHAARYGSWAGLGITVALQSVPFSDFAARSHYWQSHRDLASFLGFAIAFSGYVLFLFGLFSYHRMRIAAQGMAGSTYNTNFVGIL